jgi:excisionase family DNA binding protein
MVRRYQFHPPKSWTSFALQPSFSSDADIRMRGYMSSDGNLSDSAERSSMNGDLLTADEVARILRVPKSWVYSHVSDLPAIRLGRYLRFRRCDIDEFLEKKGTCE